MSKSFKKDFWDKLSGAEKARAILVPWISFSLGVGLAIVWVH